MLIRFREAYSTDVVETGSKEVLLTWFALMRLDDDVILRWCMLAQIRVRSLIHSLSVLIATVLLQVFF